MKYLSFMGLIFSIGYNYYVPFNERKIYTICFTALYCGLLFQSYSITKNWKVLLLPFVCSCFVVITSLLPVITQNENFFEEFIELFSFPIIFMFALFLYSFYQEKITIKLSEGITLIQSLSLIYFVADFYLQNSENIFTKIALFITIILSSFSIFHALTYFKLSNTVRLTLSIWSTVIALIFSLINIYYVLHNNDIQNSSNFSLISQSLNIALQYFLLGISVVFFAQNFGLLVQFMPKKNPTELDILENLLESKIIHIERFSDNQENISNSIFCIMYVIIMFGLNLKLNYLPSLTMIWLVIYTVPLILNSIRHIKNYR